MRLPTSRLGVGELPCRASLRFTPFSLSQSAFAEPLPACVPWRARATFQQRRRRSFWNTCTDLPCIAHEPYRTVLIPRSERVVTRTPSDTRMPRFSSSTKPVAARRRVAVVEVKNARQHHCRRRRVETSSRKYAPTLRSTPGSCARRPRSRNSARRALLFVFSARVSFVVRTVHTFQSDGPADPFSTSTTAEQRERSRSNGRDRRCTMN